MAATPEDLFARLDKLGIPISTHRHPAVFTVAESAANKGGLPGAHSKNLFLKDRKGTLFLVVARDETRIDLKRLHEAIGAAGRVSFASAELLSETLGVAPGSVTPFAAINDPSGRARIVLDRALMEYDLLNFHPLVNTMTTAIRRDDLVAFLRWSGHEPLICDLPAPAGGPTVAGTELTGAERVTHVRASLPRARSPEVEMLTETNPSQDAVKETTTAGFRQDVMAESMKQPVLVDFWAPWCGPCKQLAPALEKAVKAAKGKVKLVKMNIDEHPQIAGQLGVQSIPAVFAFSRGQPVDGFMGALPESQINAFIERVVGPLRPERSR